MDWSIKRLGAQDVTLLHGLLDCFGDAFDDPQTYGEARPDRDYLCARLTDPSFIALTALAGDTVIGGLAAYELKKFEQARSELYIYDLAVAADHRRRGVATALIQALRPIARDCGAWVIYVQADYGDEPALALYASLGTREEVLHFDIPVRRTPD